MIAAASRHDRHCPIRARFAALLPHLDERERRLVAATEARLAGYGGIAAVSRATGIAASTIGRGLRELAAGVSLDPSRVRRAGGGRTALTTQAAFAVNAIRRWWLEVGRVRYPGAGYLVITADGGGSNGWRVKLWKRELQRLERHPTALNRRGFPNRL